MTDDKDPTLKAELLEFFTEMADGHAMWTRIEIRRKSAEFKARIEALGKEPT